MAVNALLDVDTKLIRAGFLGILFGVCKGECKIRLAVGRTQRVGRFLRLPLWCVQGRV
jgi:hypothetical protein